MKWNSIDELLQNTEEIKASPYFTQRVMYEVRGIVQKQHSKIYRTAFMIDMKRLGISMIMTAVLIFATVFLPTDKTDVLHHAVQAQTREITRQTNHVDSFMYDPIRAFNKFIEDFQKKISKMKEVYQNDK